MPIYEYACTSCSHAFDRLRSISRMDDEAPCPECGGDSQRQLSVFVSFSSSPNGEIKAVPGGGGGCCGGGANGAGCACSMTV
jgi:putative FmdB family regulatory protein